jgi:Fur family transcriptional regulator, ferric uptake regulator
MQYKDDLSQSGIKLTKPRLALLSLLEKEGKPLDAAELSFMLKGRADQATVYRILDLLTNKGIILRLEFGEGKYRYELKKNHHHHLICQNCDSIEDVEGEYLISLEAQLRKKSGFFVKSHSLEFFGVCKRCQQ